MVGIIRSRFCSTLSVGRSRFPLDHFAAHNGNADGILVSRTASIDCSRLELRLHIGDIGGERCSRDTVYSGCLPGTDDRSTSDHSAGVQNFFRNVRMISLVSASLSFNTGLVRITIFDRWRQTFAARMRNVGHYNIE